MFNHGCKLIHLHFLTSAAQNIPNCWMVQNWNHILMSRENRGQIIHTRWPCEHEPQKPLVYTWILEPKHQITV